MSFRVVSLSKQKQKDMKTNNTKETCPLMIVIYAMMWLAAPIAVAYFLDHFELVTNPFGLKIAAGITFLIPAFVMILSPSKEK